jgi:BioD-like phosphotransacetylase family protein
MSVPEMNLNCWFGGDVLDLVNGFIEEFLEKSNRKLDIENINSNKLRRIIENFEELNIEEWSEEEMLKAYDEIIEWICGETLHVADFHLKRAMELVITPIENDDVFTQYKKNLHTIGDNFMCIVDFINGIYRKQK